jgi:hypothetical protein
MRRTLLLLAFPLTAVFVLSAPASAKPRFLEHLKSNYGLGANVKCDYCHEVTGKEKPGKKNLGAFGKDYQKAMGTLGKDNLDAIVKSLEPMDSDGDGATNLEELRLGTKPGDGSSTPKPELLEKFRKSQPAPKK